MREKGRVEAPTVFEVEVRGDRNGREASDEEGTMIRCRRGREESDELGSLEFEQVLKRPYPRER